MFFEHSSNGLLGLADLLDSKLFEVDVLDVPLLQVSVTCGCRDGGLPVGVLDGGLPVGVLDGGLPVGVLDGGLPVGVLDGGLPVGVLDGLLGGVLFDFLTITLDQSVGLSTIPISFKVWPIL